MSGNPSPKAASSLTTSPSSGELTNVIRGVHGTERREPASAIEQRTGAVMAIPWFVPGERYSVLGKRVGW